MDAYTVLYEDDDKVVVKDNSINGMTITLTKIEFEKWKAIKDRVKKI